MTSASGTESSFVAGEAAARVARLTPRQLQCLRLVGRHLTSKEIALALNISPHTVDQRIRIALHVLGVERRSQAARLIDSYGTGRSGTIPGPNSDPPHRRARWLRAGPLHSWLSLPLPFATRSRPRNDMSIGFRLLWIVLIAMGAALSAGMYLAGLESLSRLLRG